MVLVFNRAGADGNIGHDIGQILQVVRIKHLIGCRHTGFLEHTHMHMADGKDPLKHIRLFFGIRLMEHTHITFSSGPRLIRIDSGDDDQLILCSLLNLCKAVRIVADRILIISGAGTDDHQEFITLAGNDLFNFFISFFF